jgi:hypothetical protein
MRRKRYLTANANVTNEPKASFSMPAQGERHGQERAKIGF